MTTPRVDAYTPDRVRKLLGDNELIEQVNVWLRRGDGIAIYVNHDLSSAGLGENRFLSYGSPEAQLETDTPPERMPDINESGWRFTLDGTYRGEQLRLLPSPDEIDLVKPTVVFDRVVEMFSEYRPSMPNGRVIDASLVLRFGAADERVRVAIELTVRHIPETADLDTITLATWTDEDGLVDRLGPWEWHLGVDGDMTGTDPNLGGALVSVYNLTLQPRGE